MLPEEHFLVTHVTQRKLPNRTAIVVSFQSMLLVNIGWLSSKRTGHCESFGSSLGFDRDDHGTNAGFLATVIVLATLKAHLPQER